MVVGCVQVGVVELDLVVVDYYFLLVDYYCVEGLCGNGFVYGWGQDVFVIVLEFVWVGDCGVVGDF